MKDYKYIDIFYDLFDNNVYRSKDEIGEFETKNQIKLPKDYIDFNLEFPIGNRGVNWDKGYGYCNSVLFKDINITSTIGVIHDFPVIMSKKLINGKERLVINIGTTSIGDDFLQDFFMILDEEDYGTIYHDKFFEMAMHRMNIKVADSFTELLDNVLNGRDLPDDDSDDFDMDEDDDECEYFTEEEKKLTHEVPYYF